MRRPTLVVGECANCEAVFARFVPPNVADRVRFCSERCTDRAMTRAVGTRAPKRARPSLQDRLMARLVHNATTGCIEWMGAVNQGGYGLIGCEGSLVVAHRVSWELSGKTVPLGLELDHLCVNPRCCNVEHLELVTHRENMRRAYSRRAAQRSAAARA